MMEKKPSFDRSGVSKGPSWLGWLLTLGGGDARSIAMKYVISIAGMENKLFFSLSYWPCFTPLIPCFSIQKLSSGICQTDLK